MENGRNSFQTDRAIKNAQLGRFPNGGAENQRRYQGDMKFHQMADVMCN